MKRASIKTGFRKKNAFDRALCYWLIIVISFLQPSSLSFASEPVIPEVENFIPVLPIEELSSEETDLSASLPSNFLSDGEVLSLAENRGALPQTLSEALESGSLQEGVASAVILSRMLTQEDMKAWRSCRFEVAVGVLNGQLVAFTSGQEGEISTTSPAFELFLKPYLATAAHNHPIDMGGESHIDSLNAVLAPNIEFVIESDKIYSYNTAGDQGTYSDEEFLKYMRLALETSQKVEGDEMAARKLLNWFIAEQDRLNRDSEKIIWRAHGNHATPGPTLDLHGSTAPNPVHGGVTTVLACRHATPPCLWSDTSTWMNGAVPDANARVIIDGTILVDTDITAHSVGIYPAGKLIFATDRSIRFEIVNLIVFEGGELEIGTETNPVPDTVKTEIIFRDVPFNTTNPAAPDYDPDTGLHGLLVFGKITVHGAVKLSDATEVRLAAEPHRGDTTLTFENSVTGWKVGDTLAIPDTRAFSPSVLLNSYPYQPEEVTIIAISADGKTVTLSSALTMDHLGAIDPDGTIKFLPQIANVTRNVVFKSENPQGVRGHTMFLHRADVDVRFAAFEGLGRTSTAPIDNTTYNSDGSVAHIGTNQIARYPIHTHHLIGPVRSIAEQNDSSVYQFKLIGNSVNGMPNFDAAGDGQPKWAVTIHASHFGLIQDNVVYNAAGAGIATEDGTESYNVFDGNFVVNIPGPKFPDNFLQDFGDKAGEHGSGFWFAGVNNYIRGNVSANTRRYGFVLEMKHLGVSGWIPLFKGADPTVAGEYGLINRLNDMEPPEFDDNEASNTLIGFNFYAARGTLTNSRAWNTSRTAAQGYYTQQAIRLINFTARGHRNQLKGAKTTALSTDVYSPVYCNGCDIRGFHYGVYNPGFQSMEIINSVLQNNVNYYQNYNDPTNKVSVISALDNVLFLSMPGVNTQNIVMDFDLTRLSKSDITMPHSLYVYNYNQIAGHDFRVYYDEQAHDYIMPQSTATMTACPDAGLTNAQCFATHGVATAGAVAPANVTAMAGITGLVETLTTLAPRIHVSNPGIFQTYNVNDSINVSYTTDDFGAIGNHAHFCFARTIPPSNQLNSLAGVTMDFDLDGNAQVKAPAAGTGLWYFLAWAVDSNHNYVGPTSKSNGRGFFALPVMITNPNVTTPDLTAPILSNIAVSNISRTAATISWDTNEAADTLVESGLNPTKIQPSSPADPALGTSHTVNLDLTKYLPGQTIYYRVTSRDAAGNLMQSAIFSFQTTKIPDITAPVISAVLDSNLTSSGATITWTTDETSDSQIEYGLTMSYGNSTAPDKLMVTSHSQILSGLLADTIYHYRVRSVDAAGNVSVSGDFTFTTLAAVTPPPTVNQPPTANALTVSGSEDQAVSFTLTASDPDLNQTLTLSVTQPLNLNGTLSCSGNGSSCTFTPNLNFNGATSFTFTASDGTATSQPATVTITINPVNDAPVAQDDSATTDEDAAATVNPLANNSDVDGDALKVTRITAGPSNGSAAVNADGTITYTPNTNFNGTDSFVYEITDGNGEVATAAFNFIVNAVNDAPVLAAIGNKTGNENNSISFNVAASDIDGNVTVTASGLPVGATFDGVIFSWIPDFTQAGTYQFTFAASDGSLTDLEVVTFTIANVNRPPVLSSIGSQTVNEGQPLTIAMSVTDPDGDAVTYISANLPAGATFDAVTGNFTWTPDHDQSGSYNVTFSISDGTLTAQETVTVTVVNVNRAPVIGSVPDLTIREGVTITPFTITASDPDGDPLNFSANGLPTGLAIDSKTGIINGIPSAAGTFSVTVWVNDGAPGMTQVNASLSDSTTFTINVVTNTLPQPAQNNPPVLSGLSDHFMIEGSLLQFSVSASDQDGDLVTLSVAGLPPGATFDATSGKFSWTPANGQAGTYAVKFLADDGVDFTSQTITINVASFTPPASQGLAITNISASVSGSTATVTVTTNLLSPALTNLTIQYGEYPLLNPTAFASYTDSVQANLIPGTATHSVVITGKAGKTYAFTVTATDAAGNSVSSGPAFFTIGEPSVEPVKEINQILTPLIWNALEHPDAFSEDLVSLIITRFKSLYGPLAERQKKRLSKSAQKLAQRLYAEPIQSPLSVNFETLTDPTLSGSSAGADALLKPILQTNPSETFTLDNTGNDLPKIQKTGRTQKRKTISEDTRDQYLTGEFGHSKESSLAPADAAVPSEN